MRKVSPIQSDYFEQKYTANIDPWNFRTSEYERDKYQTTLRALTRQTYENGLEVGCSIGVFTRLLRPHCEHLLAIDTSETAIEAAKNANEAGVKFRVATLPDEFPEGLFDLIVLSEVLYYFSEPDLERVARACANALTPTGEIILCHWLGETDYPLTGEAASDIFTRVVRPSLPARLVVHDEVYRLERVAAF